MSPANPEVSSAPDTRHGFAPNPAEDDTHLEPQGLHVKRKHLRLGEGMAAGVVLVTTGKGGQV